MIGAALEEKDTGSMPGISATSEEEEPGSARHQRRRTWESCPGSSPHLGRRTRDPCPGSAKARRPRRREEDRVPYPGSATGSVIAEGANKERKDRHNSKFLCKEVDPKNFRSSDKVD
jgi:hypothetical protein